jgi:hypothetical protein
VGQHAAADITKMSHIDSVAVKITNVANLILEVQLKEWRHELLWVLVLDDIV